MMMLDLPSDVVREDTPLARHAQAIHELLEPWLEAAGATLACGRWEDGAVSEIALNGQARLLPEKYDGPFVGIRELRLQDAPHHLHVDLGRVEKISFAVSPSVCLGFKPSFEVRLLTRTQPSEWLVAVMLRPPYAGGDVDLVATQAFFAAVAQQRATQPGLTELHLDDRLGETAAGRTMLDIWRAMNPVADEPQGPSEHTPCSVDVPPCLPVLKAAMQLDDASLVIFRHQTLVEFKTDHLDGLHRHEEHGYVSWQLGAFKHHHCHLSLNLVTQVLFSAEPVSCQGGGLNYTIWFLTDTDCGNPYRSHGYFSITLNRPYLHRAPGAMPRMAVIQPILDLYRRFAGEPWVAEDDGFLAVLADGAPGRPIVGPV